MINYTKLSPSELWDLSINDDHSAFKTLFEMEFSRLYNYGMKFYRSKVQVEDAIQEIFLDLYQNRKQRTDILNIQYYLLKSFKYKIMAMSAKVNIIDIEIISSDQRFAHKADISNANSERINQLQHHLGQLAKNQREILHLKYYQNLSNKEIADFLNINYQSVSNLIYRSIGSLKKKFVKKISP